MNKRAKAVRPTLTLAPVIQILNPDSKEVDRDTINLLRGLLREAEGGQISGFMYTLIRPDGRYTPDVVGLDHGDLTFCIGVLDVLKARLLKEVLES